MKKFWLQDARAMYPARPTKQALRAVKANAALKLLLGLAALAVFARILILDSSAQSEKFLAIVAGGLTIFYLFFFGSTLVLYLAGVKVGMAAKGKSDE